MAIYAISDLHLALSVNKPMDVFGERWVNYMEKLKAAWELTVSPNDFVIIPGDISWATYLEEAVDDFNFIEALPGIKVISKGNHDYWWTTKNKLEKFRLGNNLSSIKFMHNNCYKMENITLCGTRGWKCPGDADFGDEDRKIYNRELQRLELSLQSAKKEDAGEILVALHYPPFNVARQPSEFMEIMKSYGVKNCIYGHLHSHGFKIAVQGEIEGIIFKLVSADYLEFVPSRLF